MQTLPINSFTQFYARIVAERTDSLIRPFGLYTGVSGLVVGHNWKPLGGFVNIENNKLYYQADMIHEWKLLGFVLKTTIEKYAGNLPLTQPQQPN